MPAGDNLPPFAEEAEAGVLACCLLDAEQAVPEVIEKLGDSGEAFYDHRHRLIWEHVSHLYASNKAVDVLLLQHRLDAAGALEKAGGLAYLTELPDKSPSAANAPYYAEIVWEAWLRRQMVAACATVDGLARDKAQEVRTALDRIEQTMFGLLDRSVKGTFKPMREIMASTIAQLEQYHRGGAQLRGLSTGIPYLDKMTCGLGPGEMILIGGRPGEGKTTLAMNIVEHVAVNLKKPAGVFSLEMSASSLGSRLLFQHARADYQRFRTGYMENADVPKLTAAAARLVSSSIIVDETPGLTVNEIRARSRSMKRKFGIELVVVDYFQLIAAGHRSRDRQEDLAQISKDLKGLAKELGIPVVVVAALNRESERERGREPKLSDLREAGQLEYDADVVGLLYKPKQDDAEKESLERQLGGDWSRRVWRANLRIAKQRNGPTGDVELVYQMHCMRFEPYVRSATVHCPPGPKIRPEDLP